MLKLVTALLVSSALLSGCASNQVSEEKYSGFLSDYSILKQSPRDEDTRAYVAPDVDWSQYNNVMVDKVLVMTPDGDEEQQADPKLLIAIAERYEALIKDNLSHNFTIVDQPGEGTIRFQAAITSVYSSFDDLKAYQYIPISAAITGVARASGSSEKNARVMTEMKMIDSVKGQLLAQAIDLKAGKEISDENPEITLSDVLPVLDQWAQRIAERLTSFKNGEK